MDTIHNRFLHSMFWSGAFATALLTGCNKPSDTEKAPREQTTSQTKEAKDKAAPPAPDAEVVEVEKKLDQPMDAKQANASIEEGRKVATAIDAAIVAIDAGLEADAKAEVTKAQDALAKLEHHRPNVEFIVTLWRGKHELVFVEQDTLDTIPLLESVTRVEVPVYDRGEIKARLEHRKGQAPGSASKKDKSTDLEIVDANLVYEEVDLPIASTAVHVRAAKKLLDEGNLAAAKLALLDAVGSIRVIEIIEEAPEYQAQKLVWAAQTAFANDDMNEAKRLLTEANSMLSGLKHDEDPEGQTMVNMLIAEMKPLQEAFDMGAKPSTDEFAKIVHNAKSFVRRSTLRAVLAARHETERLALADALTWLEKSQTEGLSKPEANAASSRDLTFAEAALARASKAAPASAKPQLDDLHARVAHLITLDADKSRKPDEIRSELRSACFELRMLMLDLGAAPTSNTKPTSQG